jgi:hypothetical protein
MTDESAHAIPSSGEAAPGRPVRLTVTDDTKRSRGTVFFRVIFALPLLIWLAVWAIGAIFVALANWAATLVRGESPKALHDFLARFVRYATQVNAYAGLAAEPLPAFDGEPGYPVDVEIGPPAPQGRLAVAFRLVLVIPALVLLTVFAGGGNPISFALQSGAGSRPAVSAIGAAAFLGWFYAMVRRRMPRGLRDLAAYGLSYGAQVWAYLLLLTDRYPSSDPMTAIGRLPERSDPVRLEVDDDLRRNRLTVFFRLPLAFPHLVWLYVWSVIAGLAALVNWVCTLVAGRSPGWLHAFLAAYVRYQTHVSAFLSLVGNPFPGFVGAEGSYPIALHVSDRGRQNRWSVLFRAILALPALLLANVYLSLAFTVAVLGWFASLITGRMTLGLRNAGALALRYIAQATSYLLLLTDSYPYSGPCVERPPAPPGGEVAAPNPAPA